MDLVIHKVVQFQQVLDAHSHGACKLLTRTTIKQYRLTRGREPGTLKRVVHIGLFRAIKDRRCNWNATCDIACCFNKMFLVHPCKAFLIDVIAVRQAHRLAYRCQIARPAEFLQRFVNVHTQTACGPAHVRLKDLTNVHSRRHAQRI